LVAPARTERAPSLIRFRPGSIGRERVSVTIAPPSSEKTCARGARRGRIRRVLAPLLRRQNEVLDPHHHAIRCVSE
jgi:hypothetical protein